MIEPIPLPRRVRRAKANLRACLSLSVVIACATLPLVGAHAQAPASQPPTQSTSPQAGRPSPPAKLSPAQAAAFATQDPGTDTSAWCTGVTSLMRQLSTTDCLSMKFTDPGGRSVKGVPLWTTDVAPPSSGTGALRVLVLGGIHGDEEASVFLVLDWIARARASSGVRPIYWRMTPMVNPDGFFRRPRTRVNARGVDLNRNFATHEWKEKALPYWASRTRKDPRRFPGTAALSEPESQWVHRQIDSFRPDLIVSVHAPYGVLDFDGPPPPPTHLGSLVLDPVGIYPGSLGNYGGLVFKVPVVTIELKHSAGVSTPEMAAMWNDLHRWIGQRLVGDNGSTRVSSFKQPPRSSN